MGRLFVTLQYLLPHHLLCRFVYALSRSQRPWLKNALIRSLRAPLPPATGGCARDRADALSELQRLLHARTQARGAADRRRPPRNGLALRRHRSVRPACSRTIELLQAKGHRYRLEALLATPAAAPQLLRGGHYRDALPGALSLPSRAHAARRHACARRGTYRGGCSR